MGIRLTHLVVARARWVLVISVLLVAAAGVLGAGAIAKLQGGGFDDPASESSRAKSVLENTFHQEQANVVLLVTATSGRSIDDPQVAAQGRQTVSRLAAEPGVRILGDYWAASGPAAAGLKSIDGTRGLVLAHLSGNEDATRTRMDDLSKRYSTTGSNAQIRVETGGFAQANRDITDQVTKDLGTAESVAIPLTLILLIVVFASVVAGLLPLMVGGIAIAGTFAALSAIASVTDVSIFALNLTTALGLGLAIDYSLLIVSRFREELAAGHPSDQAVAITMRTAGRTVIFSAATIAVALAALLVFPLFFLRSFAYAGIAVVAIAAAASVLTLPALLTVLGTRVNSLPVGRRLRRGGDLELNGTLRPSFWGRLARFVMRRPVLAAIPVVAILLSLGLPFLAVNFGLPDDRVIPPSASQARRVGDVLRTDFASRDGSAITVLLPSGLTSKAPATNPEASPGERLTGYASALSNLAGVARVDSAVGSFAAGHPIGTAPATGGAATSGGPTVLQVVPSVDPYGDAAQTLVHDVRALPAPGDRLVGGASATLVDVKASIAGRLPLAIALIAATTFILLFLFTGSVVIPVKALVINAVSIVGVLGAMVWIFQQGHLSGLLGFTPGPLSITMPLLMFCVAFGLSMDYEVFLLGRIKEQHDAGADTVTAIGTGLERTGRIVSTAAALLAITFFAFVTSKVSFIQMFGLGTGLAIVLDATLVRGVLVPALMRLMGGANWWAPAPLRRLHERFGLSEGEGQGHGRGHAEPVDGSAPVAGPVSVTVEA